MEKIINRYREWAISYQLAHWGTEDPRILSFINSLYEYVDHLEEINEKVEGIINVWDNSISCFPSADSKCTID